MSPAHMINYLKMSIISDKILVEPELLWAVSREMQNTRGKNLGTQPLHAAAYTLFMKNNWKKVLTLQKNYTSMLYFAQNVNFITILTTDILDCASKHLIIFHGDVHFIKSELCSLTVACIGFLFLSHVSWLWLSRPPVLLGVVAQQVALVVHKPEG